MKYSLSTQHIELSVADRDMLEKKLDRLSKYLQPPWQTDVMLRHDTHHRRGQVITCRVNITQERRIFHAERSGDSVQDALDQVIGALKKELTKYRSKQGRGRIRRWLGI